jgi:predicted nucleic acid-binding protein
VSDCVVDASVAVKWFVRQPGSAKADAALAFYEFQAPALLLIEIASALWKYRRAGLIPEEQGVEAISGIEDKYVLIEPIREPLVDRARACGANRGAVSDGGSTAAPGCPQMGYG